MPARHGGGIHLGKELPKTTKRRGRRGGDRAPPSDIPPTAGNRRDAIVGGLPSARGSRGDWRVPRASLRCGKLSWARMRDREGSSVVADVSDASAPHAGPGGRPRPHERSLPPPPPRGGPPPWPPQM